MQKNDYRQGYILRYYLPVKPYFDEDYTEKRFAQLLEYCTRVKIDAVMFYVALNPDFYYVPDTPEYAAQVQKQMLPYIKRLREHGIGYQLNFQNLVGATLGGVDFSQENKWENLVDYKGRTSKGCGCFIGKKFRKNSEKRLKIWAETKPDIIWIDDDFRLFNHGTPTFAVLEGEPRYMDFYCFCDEHIARFNKEECACYTRETLVADMLKEGISATRKKYLRFLGNTINETAKWIEQTIHAISPETRIAQMTAWPDAHAAEGREWAKFLPALCGEFTPITRPHFGPYQERVPSDFVICYIMLDHIIAEIRETYSHKVEYCPEIENTRFTVWAKSAAATSFQLALSAFMGCKDITLSLYDLEGGAFFDEPRYEEMLIKERAFLDKLVKLQLGNGDNLGLKVLTSENSAIMYNLRKNGSFSELSGENRSVENYLLAMGIPCCFTSSVETVGRDVFVLDSFSASFLTEKQLHKILSCNVFMDGGAAEVLVQRGLGQEIGISNITKQKIIVNVEIIKRMKRIDGTYIRIPLRTPEECWYSLSTTTGTEILSTFSTPDGLVFPGMVQYKNTYGGHIVVYPVVNQWGDGFFTHHRVTFFKEVFAKMNPALPRIDVANKSLAVVKKQGDKTYYFYSNLSTDTICEIKINGIVIKEILKTYQVVVFEEQNGFFKKIGKTRL